MLDSMLSSRSEPAAPGARRHGALPALPLARGASNTPGRSQPRHASRPIPGWWILGLAFFATACAGPRPQPSQVTGNPAYTSQSGLPPWSELPTSWSKLDTIEKWLKGQGSKGDPFWRIEGRLQLAEGRMELFRTERAQLDPETGAKRIASARADFMRVQADPQATDGQLRRAKRGLAAKNTATAAATTVNRSLPRGVLPRSAWGARRTNARFVTPATVPWIHITVHHSAQKTTAQSVASLAQAKTKLRGIQDYHMDERGWGDVGYHFLIDPVGRIFEGRPMLYQGAHAGGNAKGNHNVGNIGICLLGHFDEQRPTQAALRSMRGLVDALKESHGISGRALHGHLDWMSTECPGRNLLPEVRKLARRQ